MVDDIDIEGINTGFGLKGMGVPAITVPIILHYYDKKQLREALGLGAEIALLTLGGGELVLAYRFYRSVKNFEALKRLGVAIIDVSAASIDAYCGSNPATELCKKWKTISPYVAAGLITVSAHDLLKSRPNDLGPKRIEDMVEVGARMSLKQKYPTLSNFRNWMDQAGDFPEGVLERLEEVDDVTFFQKLDGDLDDPYFLAHLNMKPESVRAWEVLRNVLELRRDFRNLDLLLSFRNRFRYEGTESWEAMRALFASVPEMEHDDLIELLIRADRDFDNNDLFSIKASFDTNGDLFLELEGGIVYSPLSKPVIGDLSQNGLDISAFEDVVMELTLPHIDHSKVGARRIFGNDDSVIWGLNYPTQPGILDIHVHGDFVHQDNFNLPVPPGVGEFVVASSENGIWMFMTPSQFADIIKSTPDFDNFNAVRLFQCFGIAGGQEIADLISKPVIVSTYEITVNSAGNMWLKQGTMIKLTNN